MEYIIMLIILVPMGLFWVSPFISSIRDAFDRKSYQELEEKKRETEKVKQEYEQKIAKLTPKLAKEKCDSLIKEYEIKLASLTEKERIAEEKACAAEAQKNSYISRQNDLVKRYTVAKEEIEYREKNIDFEIDQKVREILREKETRLHDLMVDTNRTREYLNQQLTPSIDDFLPGLQLNRLEALQQHVLDNRFFNAYNERPEIHELKFEAQIKSSNGEEIYYTTLGSCTCKDFKYNRKGKPCKHILYLAYVIGLLQINQKMEESNIQKIASNIKKVQDLDAEIKRQEQKIKLQTDSIKKLENVKTELESFVNETKNIVSEKINAYPRFAGLMADFLTLHYEKSAVFLENKKRPAYVEAERIRELKQETREIVKDKKVLEYKLAYIEALFPNIVDIFDSDFERDEDFDLETDETTDRTRKFLSHEEFSKLSIKDRNQLALDRYLEGRKSKWQIGRDYEMYIGQQFESRGFNVAYTGIIENIEDMGRDLICKKQDVTYVVQCKNWAQEKEIHEKHVFQLYGTVVLRQIETPHEKVVGVFVTTTDLSSKARKIAEHLNIMIYTKIPLQDFPRIKCNINRTTGEKIYHLPFDQQYDKAQIEKTKGEFYALTVEQAENAGFRRAWRHFGE